MSTQSKPEIMTFAHQRLHSATRALGFSVAAIAIATLSAGSALADTTQARCDYYPRGEDRAEASMPCSYSQRQGVVSIQGQDGRRHEFTPIGYNRYRDQQGRQVIREDGGFGNRGTIYRTATQSIFVYWDLGDAGGDRPPRPSQPINGAFSDEITCRTFDEEITVLRNSRNQLIFQGRADLMPNEPVVVGGGRIVRGADYLDRVFEHSGFRHTVRTARQGGRLVNSYITERGNQLLDRQICR